MKKEHAVLVYLAWGLVAIALVIGGVVLVFTPDPPSLEVSKIRLAAAIGTGLLVLIVFSSVLYYTDKEGAGKIIFDRVLTATVPLIGAIFGYFFGSAE